MDAPEIRYAWNGDISLAFQMLGDGEIDLLYLQGFLSNVEVNWEHASFSRFAHSLTRRCRLVITDRRGLGVSERFTPADTPPIEVLMDDLDAVIQTAELQRPVVFASGDCGYIAALYAATHPERLAGLILYGVQATERRTEQTPWGLTAAQAEEAAGRVRDEMGSGAWMIRTNPSLSLERKWCGRYERLSLTPGSVYYESHRFTETDVLSVLPTIFVPTLVIHRSDDPEVPVQGGRLVAENVPGARWVELTGGDHFPWVGDQSTLLAEIDRFLDSLRRERAELDRVLATVLFTDIVGSTEQAVALGDHDWADALKKHRQVIRSLLVRYQGREIVTTGDGFLATFEGPARAVRCAVVAVEAAAANGLQIRASCHTGEVEIMGDDVGGVAVHVGARLLDLAGPGEVIVSRTVRDLVAGSGLVFEDRGSHNLKGLADEWQVYAVVPADR